MSNPNFDEPAATAPVLCDRSGTKTVQDLKAVQLSQGARILPPSLKLREAAGRCAASVDYRQGMPSLEVEF